MKHFKKSGDGLDEHVAISADRVSKVYTGYKLFSRRANALQKAALTNVSFTLSEGETLGLLGPNGAGKTTLLKIIATLLAPSSGRVLVSSFDVEKESLAARRNLGLVNSDERSFYWRLTGRQNLMFFAALYGIPEGLAVRRIGVLLEVLGLSAAADRKFLSYSSGMKQKLAIVRGLMNEPRVVLYDEPTRALDPLSAQQIRRWIREHREQAPHQAHLLATNQLNEAVELCDKVMIVNRGSIIAYGSIDEIRKTLSEHDHAMHTIVCRGYCPTTLLTPAIEEGLLDVSLEEAPTGLTTLRIRTLRNSGALHRILADVIASHGKIVTCDSQEVSFDDVFCALVTGDQLPQSHNLSEAAAK